MSEGYKLRHDVMCKSNQLLTMELDAGKYLHNWLRVDLKLNEMGSFFGPRSGMARSGFAISF